MSFLIYLVNRLGIVSSSIRNYYIVHKSWVKITERGGIFGVIVRTIYIRRRFSSDTYNSYDTRLSKSDGCFGSNWYNMHDIFYDLYNQDKSSQARI